VALYVFLGIRGFNIAAFAPNKFARLVATGITTWILAQAFINMAVNVSLFPVTGITLPFVSYGGSSMLATLVAVGVLLNISKYLPNYALNSNRGRNRRTYNSQYRNYR
jgi:cell division protein FtsW